MRWTDAERVRLLGPEDLATNFRLGLGKCPSDEAALFCGRGRERGRGAPWDGGWSRRQDWPPTGPQLCRSDGRSWGYRRPKLEAGSDVCARDVDFWSACSLLVVGRCSGRVFSSRLVLLCLLLAVAVACLCVRNVYWLVGTCYVPWAILRPLANPKTHSCGAQTMIWPHLGPHGSNRNSEGTALGCNLPCFVVATPKMAQTHLETRVLATGCHLGPVLRPATHHSHGCARGCVHRVTGHRTRVTGHTSCQFRAALS